MNGYEMLSELGRLFSPGYAPSPGSVYPAISALSRSGLIGAEGDSAKRRYQLTPAGGEALAMRQGQLNAIEARCGVYLHDEVEAELLLVWIWAIMLAGQQRAPQARQPGND